MDNLNTSKEKAKDVQRGKKFWLWGCGGCLILLLIIFSFVAYLAFSPRTLTGAISVPPEVEQGDEFDIIITLTNSTPKSILIRDISFHNVLGASNLLEGASVINTNPEMKSDLSVFGTDLVEFRYYREIHPGETQTFTFHMKAENIGVFIGDIGVYAKHPFLGEDYFQVAQYFSAVKIEITH